MIVGITEDFGLVLVDMPDAVMEMLRAVPKIVADAGGLAGVVDPVADGKDKETASIREDWAMVVTPELIESFSGEITVLMEDLAAAEPCEPEDEAAGLFPGTGFHRVVIRPDRVEAWHGALNQARLSLEAIFAFGDERETESLYKSWSNKKRLAFGRSRLYAAIQQGLLACMEGQFGG